MNVNDLHVMLVQELGWNVENHGKFLTGFWDVRGKKQQVVLFIDEKDGMGYVSTRCDAKEIDREGLKALLHENIKRSLVKFCMDADGNVLIMAEVPAPITTEVVREAVYRVSKAAAWYAESSEGRTTG